MTIKLARWSWVLALPISAVLAAPAERAVEVPLNSTSKTATKPTPTTTVTREATPVRERSLSMRDVAPAGPGDDGVSHSIHDWVPRTPTKVAQTPTEPTIARKSQRKHWWSRPQPAANSQKVEEVNR